MHDLVGVVGCLAAFAWASNMRGELSRAAIFWGAVDRLDAELGETLWRNDRPDYEARLDPHVLADEAALAEGRALDTEQAVKLALKP